MRLFASIVLCASIASVAIAADAPAIVVLPLDNVSGAPDAPHEVAKRLAAAIEAKGWRVAGGDDVTTLLENERVRYLDSIDDGVRAKIVAATGAKAIVSGTLYTWVEGRNPTVAVAARMVRADGTLAWSDVAAIASDDTAGVCGFGRKSTTAALSDATIESLARNFPRAGDEGIRVARFAKPLFKRGPDSFRVADLDPSTPHRICVLPFENDGSDPEGPRVVADILAMRLAATNGFEVVEPAKLRAAALNARIGSFRTIGSEDLQRLAAAVGTSLFLRGTVFDYVDTAGHPGVDSRVDIELTLVDAHAGRVLWTAQHDRKGGDYVGFLMRGAVSNAVSLTDRVIAELIAAEARTPVHATQNHGPETRAALRGARTKGEK